MSTTATLHCDHLGCEETVEGRDVVHARRAARRLGWEIRRQRNIAYDFCVHHRQPRSYRD